MSALPQQGSRENVARSSNSPVPAKQVKTMSIGVVLERLRQEFPEVTVSKIRFLESEGLITPQRTSSGYRRFTQADVDRLNFILKTQRDDYLPLKVIREQLAAMDSGALTPLRRGDSSTLVSPDAFRAPASTRLTDSDVRTQVEEAGFDPALVADLLNAGVIVADSSGFFTNDDVAIAITAGKLADFGFDARHLKSLRNTAVRQADLIERAAAPTSYARENGRERADQMAQEMMALVISMHANMVKSVMRSHRS